MSHHSDVENIVGNENMNPNPNLNQETNVNLAAINEAIKLLAQNQSLLTGNVSRGKSKSLDIRLPDVNVFTGIRKESSDFLARLENFFRGQPERFSTDETKISYIITRLEGAAFSWIKPYLEDRSSYFHMLSNVDEFVKLFRAAFSDPHEKVKSTNKLLDLKQGKRSALTYATEFNELLYKSSIAKD